MDAATRPETMPPPVEVRAERPDDVEAIRWVNEAAFEGPLEAQIVDALRAADGVTSSLVAVVGGGLVGHILFSPVTIGREGARGDAVGLGPMAVLPAFQRRGVGSALVRAGLDGLRDAGHAAVVVLGHPAFYPRFGFRRASELGLRWEHDAPDEAFMALELVDGALAGVSGVVAYRPELDQAERAVDEGSLPGKIVEGHVPPRGSS